MVTSKITFFRRWRHAALISYTTLRYNILIHSFLNIKYSPKVDILYLYLQCVALSLLYFSPIFEQTSFQTLGENSFSTYQTCFLHSICPTQLLQFKIRHCGRDVKSLLGSSKAYGKVFVGLRLHFCQLCCFSIQESCQGWFELCTLYNKSWKCCYNQVGSIFM